LIFFIDELIKTINCTKWIASSY